MFQVQVVRPGAPALATMQSTKSNNLPANMNVCGLQIISFRRPGRGLVCGEEGGRAVSLSFVRKCVFALGGVAGGGAEGPIK